MRTHVIVPRSERDFQSEAVFDVGDTFTQCRRDNCEMIKSKHGKPIPRIAAESYVIAKPAIGATAAKSAFPALPTFTLRKCCTMDEWPVW